MVTIETPCLDCGAPVHLEMKDGVLLKTEPEEIRGYVAVPFSEWMERLPHA